MVHESPQKEKEMIYEIEQLELKENPKKKTFEYFYNDNDFFIIPKKKEFCENLICYCKLIFIYQDISDKLYDQKEKELLCDLPKFDLTLEDFQKELKLSSPLEVLFSLILRT